MTEHQTTHAPQQARGFARAEIERVRARHGDSAAEAAAAIIQAQFMWLGVSDLALGHVSSCPDPAKRTVLLATLVRCQVNMQEALAALSLLALKDAVSDEQSLADVAASIRSAVENAALVLAPEAARVGDNSVVAPAPGTIQ